MALETWRVMVGLSLMALWYSVEHSLSVIGVDIETLAGVFAIESKPPSPSSQGGWSFHFSMRLVKSTSSCTERRVSFSSSSPWCGS